jgi:hypothetical protein
MSRITNLVVLLFPLVASLVSNEQSSSFDTPLSSLILHGGSPREMPFSRSVENKHKISASSIVGDYPSNPKYAIIKEYADESCSQLLAAESVLLDSCFSAGSVSAKYVCSKFLMIFILVLPLIFFLFHKS